MAFGDPICNPSSFRLEARAQRVCAVCRGTGHFHAHHVVDKAILGRYGRSGKLLYDTRNALRLCEGLDTRRCHFQHENWRPLVRPHEQRAPTVLVRTVELLDENIVYAFEVLEGYAVDYLRAEYDDVTVPDPRLIELEHMAA